MSSFHPVPAPVLKDGEYDIYDGADMNDIGEIAGALDEAPMMLNTPEKLTGKTALTLAAADGNYLAAWYLLIKEGADPWIADKHGWLALDYARAIGHVPLRQMLLDIMFADLNDPPPVVGVVPLFPKK